MPVTNTTGHTPLRIHARERVVVRVTVPLSRRIETRVPIGCLSLKRAVFA
jgi:hypothetical protein